MIVQHGIGSRKFESPSFPHAHHADAIFFPEIRMLEALPDQRRAMNVHLGDLDFFEVNL